MIIYLIAICAILLVALVVRFVQPELIYGLRRAIIGVRMNKAFLDQDAGRVGIDRSFADLIITDLRYETRDYDYRYVLQRITKLRELSRMLSPRSRITDSKKAPEAAICVIELAGMLKNLGEQISDQSEDHSAGGAVGASTMLALIGNTKRGRDGLKPFTKEHEIEEWFCEHPVSVDQVVELLIAAAFALSYRQRSQVGPQEKGDSSDDLSLAVIRLEKRLRRLVRHMYDKKFGTATAVHQRFEAIIGSRDHGLCLQRMQKSRGDGATAAEFIDFLYIKQLLHLMFEEWDMFSPVFNNKEWLSLRLERIIHVRNEIFHSRLVSKEEGQLAMTYCAEVDKNLEGYFMSNG